MTAPWGESMLSGVMKRNFLHLAASGAELLRFAALMSLAAAFGATDEAGGFPRLIRYAASAQLLFAAGFFFLWLDAARYGSYRPLLAVGKAALLASLVPLAFQVGFALAEPSAGLRDPRAALGYVIALAAIDLGSLALLAFTRPPAVEAPAPAARQEAVEPVDASIPAAGDGKAEA